MPVKYKDILIIIFDSQPGGLGVPFFATGPVLGLNNTRIS